MNRQIDRAIWCWLAPPSILAEQAEGEQSLRLVKECWFRPGGQKVSLTYLRIYVCVYVCMYVRMYVCMYVCMYVSMCIYICVCKYTCMHAMYVCIHIPLE